MPKLVLSVERFDLLLLFKAITLVIDSLFTKGFQFYLTRTQFILFFPPKLRTFSSFRMEYLFFHLIDTYYLLKILYGYGTGS